MTEQQAYLIVGLGNPGQEYQHNRHNVGFMVLDRLAEKLGERFSRIRLQAFLTTAGYRGQKLLLAKPQTYMNNSGQAVSALQRYFKIPREQILVIYDDVDLPFESLRLRPEGGAGGQKGVKSIIKALGSENFPRLRVGIGRPPGRMEVSDYVLQDFSSREAEVLEIILLQAVEAVLTFIDEGIERAMTAYNQTTDSQDTP